MLKRLVLSCLCVAVMMFGAGSLASVNLAEAAAKKKVSASRSVKKTGTANRKSALRTLKAAPAAALTTAGSIAAYAAYNEARYADLIMDANSGKILREVNADARRHPASLTKMMTLYMLFAGLESGKLRLHQQLPVSSFAAAASPSKLGLRPGSSIEVEDVILGLVTRSANDAAVVAAEALGGGSEVQFARMMTETARKLGMSNTIYKNASGLPNPDQVTTARDQARLGLALLKHYPQYYPYFSRQSFNFRGQTITSHNRLLARYEGMDGMKTGFINASGFNLVTSAKRGGTRLIGVVFGGTSAASRDNQMARLMDAAFDGTLTEDGRPGVRMASAVPESKFNKDDIAPAGQEKIASRSEVTSMDEEFAAKQPQAIEQALGKLAHATAKVVGAPAAEAAEQPSTSPAERKASPLLQAEAETGTLPKMQQAALRAPQAPAAGEWGVQVGAYNDRASGQRATALVADSIPELNKASAKVVTATSSSGTIYRARLVGISEDEARRACGKLQARSRPCMVLPPAGGTAAWLASSN